MKNQKGFSPVLIIVIVAVVVVLVATGIVVAKKNGSKPTATATQTQTASKQNKANAETLQAEKNQEPVLVTNESIASAAQAEAKQGASASKQTTKATVEDSGASTNLDRPSVRPAVLAVTSIYADFLSKLQGTTGDSRQAAADKFVSDHSSYFSSTYNYAASGSLHLLPQAASVDIPEKVSAHSAIVDPEDSNQTIVQLFMDSDDSWSILAYVTMNGDGSFGKFQQLVPRMNVNPL